MDTNGLLLYKNVRLVSLRFINHAADYKSREQSQTILHRIKLMNIGFIAYNLIF